MRQADRHRPDAEQRVDADQEMPDSVISQGRQGVGWW